MPDSPDATGDRSIAMAAMAAMADGMLIADTRTGHVQVNAAARAMLSIDADIDVTTTYLKNVIGFYPFELVVAGPDGGTPIREEVRIGERVLHSVVTPLVEDGRSIGAIVVLRDLGETRDLAQRRSEFAQLMSHELRTPLTSVSGALDIMLSDYAGPLNEKQQRYLQMARQAATRMNSLVDQLLDLARAQTGSITVALTPLHLDRLTQGVVERFREAAREKQLSINVVSTAESIAILGDPDRLSQVLGNLLSNSIRFAPSGGVIEVEIFGPSLVPDAVGVSVFNGGEPIAADEHERVFEPFSASGRKIGGSGMGLSISRAIVEAHGGRMWVESGEHGSKFVFTLPGHVAPVATAVGAPAESAMPRRRTSSRPPRAHMRARTHSDHENTRVLIVDNDRHRALLIKGLLMAGGDDVKVAHDADGALASARQDRPGIVVVSSNVADAINLVAILQHDPETRKTAVLCLAEPERAAEFLDAGADEVVELPLEPLALREACARVLETGRRSAPRVMLVDDDAGIRAICREVLEQAGYQVRDLEHADMAVVEARRFHPDLILLDVMMPVFDGFQAAEALRADASTALTPIIFLSARSDTANKVRAFRAGAEDYMVKPFDAAELVARVAKALDRQARELGASPTTQLPGADAIEAEIERRLRTSTPVGERRAVACYLDLDNLKAFNDYYGYAKADAVIRQTGDLIRDVVTRVGGPGDFIGHIAGDDFVYISSADRVDAVSRAICHRFDRIIPLYYNRDDRVRGHIVAPDRFGVMREFPIMSVSIAAISLERANSYAMLSQLAAVGKQAAKAVPGSVYLRDEVVILGGHELSTERAPSQSDIEVVARERSSGVPVEVSTEESSRTAPYMRAQSPTAI